VLVEERGEHCGGHHVLAVLGIELLVVLQALKAWRDMPANRKVTLLAAPALVRTLTGRHMSKRVWYGRHYNLLF
jgi:hypothetical protein